MKHKLLKSILLAVIALGPTHRSLASGSEMKGMDMSKDMKGQHTMKDHKKMDSTKMKKDAFMSADQAKPFTGIGLIEVIKDEGTVLVLKHGDIKGLMKGMEMGFTLQDKKLGKGLKVGDRVEFHLVKGGKWYQIDTIEKLAKQYHGEGEITAIKDKGKILVIDHDEIDDLMDAMTMPYKLRDKKLGEGIKTGDEVNFTLEKKGKTFEIVEIKKAD